MPRLYVSAANWRGQGDTRLLGLGVVSPERIASASAQAVRRRRRRLKAQREAAAHHQARLFEIVGLVRGQVHEQHARKTARLGRAGSRSGSAHAPTGAGSVSVPGRGSG